MPYVFVKSIREIYMRDRTKISPDAKALRDFFVAEFFPYCPDTFTKKGADICRAFLYFILSVKPKAPSLYKHQYQRTDTHNCQRRSGKHHTYQQKSLVIFFFAVALYQSKYQTDSADNKRYTCYHRTSEVECGIIFPIKDIYTDRTNAKNNA